MKHLLIIFVCSLLFTNCKRNHYYCSCYGGTGYYKDYGTQFATKESTLKKDCDSHLTAGPSAYCHLRAE
jgi:hypothetical protein